MRIVRAVDPRQSGVRCVADRADDRGGLDLGAIVEQHAGRIDALDPTAQAQLDARVRELPGRVPTEPIAEIRQHHRLAVDQHDAWLELDVGEARGRRFHEVPQLRGDLDAGRSAADDHERELLGSTLRIGLDARLLEHLEGAVAQVDRVAEGANRDAVLGHARDRGQVRDPAERDDQRVVVDREGLAAGAPPHGDRGDRACRSAR